MDEMLQTQITGEKYTKVYDILDLIEELRGEDDLVAKIKVHCPASDAFIAAVIAFERDIQQMSLEKEAVAIVVKGEEWISNILEVSEKGLLIEPRVSEQGRGVEPRLVSISQVKQWLYK